ncbi:MAG: DUF2599 domain-containing protein [Segniliparus sp.]|uniref:DUF2599 domain-containing protein n=1 Tax=Segniliparus sp. TaxID=2804064 RepID=UPI003F40612F
MRAFAALCLSLPGLCLPFAACPDAAADPGLFFIDHVAWVDTPDGPSLHVFPAQAGRDAPVDEQSAAWAEVLRLAPEADTPGMREQFDCHQGFAKNKASWNLEPWRPPVDMVTMLASACNPGKQERPQT